MTGDVGQRLLHDPEHCEFGIGRQSVDIRRHIEIDRDAAALDIAIDVTA
jgi:hypothetical protein